MSTADSPTQRTESDHCCDVPEAGAATCERKPSVAVADKESKKQLACPSCGKKGKPVDLLTVKALLGVALTEIRSREFRFCATPDCETVYYSRDGAQTFTERHLRERVFQKHPDDPSVPVCYCFEHTPATIRSEIESTGKSTVFQRVTEGIQHGQCACEIRNPQGSCCLGNVTLVVKRYLPPIETGP